MKDTIYRADAIEAVRKKLQDWGSYAFEDYRRGLYEAQDILEALPSAEPSLKAIKRQIGEHWYLDPPSAEAVQVVRCKDCRHRDLFSCPLADNDFQKDDDFCSWGERKGGDDE